MLQKLLDRIDGWRINFCVRLAFSVALSMFWLVVTPRWVLGCAAAPSSHMHVATPAFAAPSKSTAPPAPTRTNPPVGATERAPFPAVTSARGLAVTWRSALHRNAIDFIRHALGSEAMLAELDASDGRHRIFELFRSTLECDLNDFIRVGGAGDGGKWVCGVENLRRRRNVGRGPSYYNALDGDAFNGADVFGAGVAGAPCIVYSLGSHNNFDWENGIKAQLPFCDIFTFDCTEQNPSNRPAFVEFKPWCVGNAPARARTAAAPTYLPLSGIMERLGHKSVALLKMDVEGAEFEVFAEIAKLGLSSRPRQIVFELHYMNFERQFASKLIISSMLAILESGYQVVSRERNQSCPSCMETILIYTGVGVA